MSLTITKIQIGPYAAKTGAKPNTIIKRLAGIKSRNGLNISTTLGNYKRPVEQSGVSPTAEAKRGQKRNIEALNIVAEEQPKHDQTYLWRNSLDDQGPRTESGLSTATTYSSLSSPSFPGQFSPPQWRMQAHEQTTLIQSPEISTKGHAQQEFQELLGTNSSNTDIDGVAVKRIKIE